MWRVLLLHVTPRPGAVRLATSQHLRALERVGKGSEVLSYNAVHRPPAWLRHLRFDAVVLHTTYLCMRWNPWFERWRPDGEWLAELDALKIAFPQDEYDHAAVLDGWLRELGVTVVCTVLDETHRRDLYPTMHREAAFYEVLTGYIDDDAACRIGSRLLPAAQRPRDVVYRARKPPYWFGSHSQLKHLVGEAVLERAPAHGLACDVSTRMQETVLGDAWLDFLATGRATIGVESGSSVLDARGDVRARIAELLEADPGLTFDQVAAQMPPGWDDYRFFALSPRHLEAVVTKTAQVLVEGRYSDVLEPGRHYLPLRRDLANLDDVLEAVRDRATLERVAEQAYADVYSSGRYSSRALTERLERILAEHGRPRSRRLVEGKRGFGLAALAASATAEAGRVAVAPAANVVRVGGDGLRELLAGARLVARDPSARRLLVRYLRSTETREYVSPREALADLLVIGSLRDQAAHRDGEAAFAVSVELDRERRRVVVRTLPLDGARRNGARTTPAELAGLLAGPAWEFLLDHSRVGRRIEVPLAAGRTLAVGLPGGPRQLKTFNWLAVRHPGDVAVAFAPLLGDGGP